MNAIRPSGSLLALLAAAFCACPKAPAQGIRCGAGQDLVVQALERITPQSGNDAFEDALQLLKHAVQVCPELGDAWYYRSLVEQRLGHDSLAKYALDKARFNGSEALAEGLNPLVLATPASRGIAPEEGTETPAPIAAPVRPGPVEQKWALVVGIGHFTDGEIPRLNYTTADANAFAATLKDPNVGGFPAANVHVLTDEQATTKTHQGRAQPDRAPGSTQRSGCDLCGHARHPADPGHSGRRQLPGHLRH